MNSAISQGHGANRRVSALRQAAVERAEAYLRAHPSVTVSLADLSRAAGLSERGLRSAFHAVRGMSPKRFIGRERLYASGAPWGTHEARRPL